MLRIGRNTALTLGVLCLASLHCDGGGGGTGTETDCADSLDNDGDGRIDCNDTDCAANPVCTASCNFNAICEAGENNNNCPFDCPSAICGNSVCEAGETAQTCPGDCASSVCGNGLCEVGETLATCPADCTVNTCGNGTCDAGETEATCPADCGASTCGNGTCDTGETEASCPADCGGPCDYNSFNAVAESASSTPSKMYYQAQTSAALPADVLQIEIWPSYGGPDTPGTYDLQIDGNDNYETCGLCPLMMLNATSTDVDKIFYADTGTIEITSIGGIGSTFAAILHNVVFREVTIDQTNAHSNIVSGGETWCLNGYSFSQTVEEGVPCPNNCIGDTISDFSITSCDTGQPVSISSLATGQSAVWFLATHDW